VGLPLVWIWILQIVVVSFIANATPFFGVSYTLLATSFLLEFGFTPGLLLLVILVTGVSAAVAKCVIYYSALGFGSLLKRNRNIGLFRRWLSRRSFLVTLFLTAFIPILPLDDYLYIGGGANRAKLSVMLFVTLIAKLLKSAFEISVEVLGLIRISTFTSTFGITAFDLSIASSVFFVLLGVALFKVDWEHLISSVPVLKRIFD
jgi:hypothetical protein